MMRSEWQQGKVACGGDNRRAEAACCFLRPELLAEFWADVDWESATADSSTIGGSMGGRQQQGEAVHCDDAGGVSTASCFLGPELQAEFRADVAQKSATADSSAIGGAEGTMGGGWQQDKIAVKEGLQVAAESQGVAPDHGTVPWMLGPESWADVVSMWCQPDATVGDGNSGGLMRSARQQGEVACGGDNGRAVAACCFLGPELQAGPRADAAWEEATALERQRLAC